MSSQSRGLSPEEIKGMLKEMVRESYKELGYPVKVRLSGRQLVIPLPTKIVQELGIKAGDTVYLEIAIDGRTVPGKEERKCLVVRLG